MFGLSDLVQGIILMSAGFVLILYTLGLFQKAFSLLIIVGSIAMIIIGFFKLGGPKYLNKIMGKKESE